MQMLFLDPPRLTATPLRLTAIMSGYCCVSGAGNAGRSTHRMLDEHRDLMRMANAIKEFNKGYDGRHNELQNERKKVVQLLRSRQGKSRQSRADVEMLTGTLKAAQNKLIQNEKEEAATKEQLRQVDEAITSCQPVSTGAYANCDICLIAKPVDNFVNRCVKSSHPVCKTCMENLVTCHMCRGALGGVVTVPQPLNLC